MASVDQCLFLDAVPPGAPPTARGGLRVLFDSMADPAFADLVFPAALERTAAYLQNPFVQDANEPDGPANPDRPIPEAVVFGVLMWARRMVEDLDRIGGATSVKTGDLAVTYGAAVNASLMPDDVQAMLWPWRIPVLAGSRASHLKKAAGGVL